MKWTGSGKRNLFLVAIFLLLVLCFSNAFNSPVQAQPPAPKGTLPPPTVPAPTSTFTPTATATATSIPTATTTPKHHGNINITQVFVNNNPASAGEPNVVGISLRSQWGMPPACDTVFRVTMDGGVLVERWYDTSQPVSGTVEIPFLNPIELGWHSIIATTRRNDNWTGDTVPYHFLVLTPTTTPTATPTVTPTPTPTVLPRIVSASVSPATAHPGQTITVEVFTNFESNDYEVGIEYFNGWQVHPMKEHNTFTFVACHHCIPQTQRISIRIFNAGDYTKTIDDTTVAYENTPWPYTSYLPLMFR